MLTLSDKTMEIISDLSSGMRQSEAARKYGVSREWVRQIVQKAVRKGLPVPVGFQLKEYKCRICCASIGYKTERVRCDNCRQLAPKRPCINCGLPKDRNKPFARRCCSCHQYKFLHGVERPKEFWGRRYTPREPAVELECAVCGQTFMMAAGKHRGKVNRGQKRFYCEVHRTR